VEGRPGREQARTRLARRAVVDAARRLFLEHGYAATTVEAISVLAGVPPATLYRLFTTKLGILEELLDTSIAGDDDPRAVSDRPEVASAFAATEATDLLAGVAGITSAINQRSNDVHRVLVGAAASDAAAADLLADVTAQRDRGQRRIVQTLARGDALRRGLSRREAEDRVHALMSPEIYRLLVVDRGWSAEKYRTWLAATLVQQLT
jgi:AcrR family transcriptional regulator